MFLAGALVMGPGRSVADYAIGSPRAVREVRAPARWRPNPHSDPCRFRLEHVGNTSVAYAFGSWSPPGYPDGWAGCSRRACVPGRHRLIAQQRAWPGVAAWCCQGGQPGTEPKASALRSGLVAGVEGTSFGRDPGAGRTMGAPLFRPEGRLRGGPVRLHLRGSAGAPLLRRINLLPGRTCLKALGRLPKVFPAAVRHNRFAIAGVSRGVLLVEGGRPAQSCSFVPVSGWMAGALTVVDFEARAGPSDVIVQCCFY